jgi:hypothetical protein
LNRLVKRWLRLILPRACCLQAGMKKNKNARGYTPRLMSLKKKAKALTGCEADLAAEEKKFQNYRVRHHKKLHDLRIELEGAMNEIGAKCLPYPKKGSTIGNIAAWFAKEIQALRVRLLRRTRIS